MSMISDQVKQLREYSKELEISCYPSESYMVKQAAETIEALSVRLHASQMERSLQYYNNGWIPCEYRMPEERVESEDTFDPVTLGVIGVEKHNVSDSVLVTVRNEYGELFSSMDCTVDGEWAAYGKSLAFDVLAWQPKPVPYKGKERD